jgi:two-component system, OmpR family, response regulator ResD
MSPTSILIVEDEPSIAEVVSLYLRRAGYAVQVLADGQEAMLALEDNLPDLLILDLMLPGLDGLSLTRWLRQHSQIPIIMLTARRLEMDRIAGLEMGADDYVVKPFSPQELVSRVKAVLRRARGPAQEPGQQPLQFDGLQIDPITRLVHWNGQEVSLTAKEFDLLWLMASHPRQVFNRQQLLERVWGEADYIDPSTVTVHMRRVREKLEADPANPVHLVTVWGVGYKFEP